MHDVTLIDHLPIYLWLLFQPILKYFFQIKLFVVVFFIGFKRYNPYFISIFEKITLFLIQQYTLWHTDKAFDWNPVQKQVYSLYNIQYINKRYTHKKTNNNVVGHEKLKRQSQCCCFFIATNGNSVCSTSRSQKYTIQMIYCTFILNIRIKRV